LNQNLIANTIFVIRMQLAEYISASEKLFVTL